jgi:DinB superfamily
MNILENLQKGFASNTARLDKIMTQMTYDESHFRAYGNTNPLIWQLGHLNYVRNTITKLLDSNAKLALMENEKELFGPQCQIQNHEAYPQPAALLAIFKQRGERIIEMLKTTTPETWAEESPFAHLSFLGTSRGEQIYGFFLHENQHLGEANMIKNIILKNRPEVA